MLSATSPNAAERKRPKWWKVTSPNMGSSCPTSSSDRVLLHFGMPGGYAPAPAPGR